jgi:hypothetical protein
VTEIDSIPRVVALLTANGYSTDEADEIVVLAGGKSNWIEVLVEAGAARARYRQAVDLAFPAYLLG